MSERRWLRAVASVLVSAGLMGVLLYRLDRQEISALLAGVQPAWLLPAAALVPLQVVLAAERWHLASQTLALPLPRGEAWREYALSTALNQLLPGGMGGDLVRVWRQRRHGLAPTIRAAIVDRYLGFIALLALATGGVLAWPLLTATPRPEGASAAMALLGIGCLGMLLAPQRLPVLGPQGRDLRRVLKSRQLGWHLSLSAALVVTLVLGFACCGRALGMPVGPWLVTAVPVSLLATAIPLSFGGWGLREAAAVASFPQLGWTQEAALALSVAYGLSFLIGALPGLAVLLRAQEPSSDRSA